MMTIRDLVLELSEDYLKIDFQDYERLLLEVWKKYFMNNSWDSNNGQLNKGNLFICPMISNVNKNVIKSGMVMAYICQDIAMRSLKEFSKLQIRICANPADLIDKVDKVGRLVLIDDYIGSGSTALCTLIKMDLSFITRGLIQEDFNGHGILMR